MPAGVVRTPHDEHLWEQAKAAAQRAGKAGHWGYVMSVFERMKTHAGGAAGRDAYRRRMKRGAMGRLILRKARDVSPAAEAVNETYRQRFHEIPENPASLAYRGSHGAVYECGMDWDEAYYFVPVGGGEARLLVRVEHSVSRRAVECGDAGLRKRLAGYRGPKDGWGPSSAWLAEHIWPHVAGRRLAKSAAADRSPAAQAALERRGTRVPSGGVLGEKVLRYLRQSYPDRVLGWVIGQDWHFHPRFPLRRVRMDRRPGGRDPKRTAAIEQAIRAGKPMEPVVLCEDGDGAWPADGYHRLLALKHLGRATVAAYVADGGPRDAAKRMHAAKLNRSARLLLGLREPLLRAKGDPLPPGAHWITISREKHPHSPLAGRHILINASGHVLAGAIPSWMHGRSVTDLSGGYSHVSPSEPRHPVRQAFTVAHGRMGYDTTEARIKAAIEAFQAHPTAPVAHRLHHLVAHFQEKHGFIPEAARKLAGEVGQQMVRQGYLSEDDVRDWESKAPPPPPPASAKGKTAKQAKADAEQATRPTYHAPTEESVTEGIRSVLAHMSGVKTIPMRAAIADAAISVVGAPSVVKNEIGMGALAAGRAAGVWDTAQIAAALESAFASVGLTAASLAANQITAGEIRRAGNPVLADAVREMLQTESRASLRHVLQTIIDGHVAGADRLLRRSASTPPSHHIQMVNGLLNAAMTLGIPEAAKIHEARWAPVFAEGRDAAALLPEDSHSVGAGKRQRPGAVAMGSILRKYLAGTITAPRIVEMIRHPDEAPENARPLFAYLSKRLPHGDSLMPQVRGWLSEAKVEHLKREVLGGVGAEGPQAAAWWKGAMEARDKTLPITTGARGGPRTLMPVAPAEVARLQAFLDATAINRHGFRLKIKQAFEIKYDQPAFEAKKATIDNAREMFHGSRKTRVANIVGSGLKMPGKSAPVAVGSMFGKGIYLAGNSTKSGQYVDEQDGTLFVVEAALGKEKDLQRADSSITASTLNAPAATAWTTGPMNEADHVQLRKLLAVAQHATYTHTNRPPSGGMTKKDLRHTLETEGLDAAYDQLYRAVEQEYGYRGAHTRMAAVLDRPIEGPADALATIQERLVNYEILPRTKAEPLMQKVLPFAKREATGRRTDYNSVHGQPGTELKNDEWVVYDEDQVHLKYALVVDKVKDLRRSGASVPGGGPVRLLLFRAGAPAQRDLFGQVHHEPPKQRSMFGADEPAGYEGRSRAHAKPVGQGGQRSLLGGESTEDPKRVDLERRYPGGVWRTVRGHHVFVHRGHIVPETLPSWMKEDAYEDATKSGRLVLRRAGGDRQGEHWVTIGGHKEGDEEHAGGSPVLLDGTGRIVGGSVPRAFQGLPVSDVGRDSAMQRHWKDLNRKRAQARAELARLEDSIPSLARYLEREARAPAQHLLAEIRRVTNGRMIAPAKSDLRTETAEIPAYLKRQGGHALDEVAEDLGISDNELLQRIENVRLLLRDMPSRREFEREAEDQVRGDSSYREAQEAVAAAEERVGKWRGPKGVSEAAERTRKWRDRLKTEGRTEKKRGRAAEPEPWDVPAEGHAALARSRAKPAGDSPVSPLLLGIHRAHSQTRDPRGHYMRRARNFGAAEDPRRPAEGRRKRRPKERSLIIRRHEDMPPEQGSGPGWNYESSAIDLGRITASRSATLVRQAVAAYRKALRTSSGPSSALQRVAAVHRWVLVDEDGLGRRFWEAVRAARLSVPAAFQEGGTDPDDREGRLVFYRPEPSVWGPHGGFTHRP